MSDHELNKSPIDSFAWKIAQSICSLGITFCIQLVLARMLMPEDFGLIAIVNVFMTLVNTVIDTSFSSAIIQRKSLSQKMLSSVFFVNILLSVTIYFVLFLAAPFISGFYSEPALVLILRVQGLIVVVSAVYSIQQALMNRKMRFKALFFCSFIGSIVQATAGVLMAYNGMGVWALVVSTFLGSVVNGLAILCAEFWKPDLYFSFKLVREALSFSSKILVIRVVKKIYYNIRVLVIGRVYDTEILGYFNKGFQFPSTAMTVVDGSLTSVSFTHLSKLENDQEQFSNSMRQYIRSAMYICTPIMVGMALIAEPLVLFLLTPKWIDCVPYLQIICISQLFVPLSIKTTALESLGRSDLSMKVNLIGICISIVLLFACTPFSALVMTFGGVISNLIWQIFITAIAVKHLHYSVWDQCKDALSGLVPSVCMAGAVLLIDCLNFKHQYWLEIAVKTTVGVVSFVVVSFITKNEVFYSILGVVKIFRRK